MVVQVCNRVQFGTVVTWKGYTCSEGQTEVSLITYTGPRGNRAELRRELRPIGTAVHGLGIPPSTAEAIRKAIVESTQELDTLDDLLGI